MTNVGTRSVEREGERVPAGGRAAWGAGTAGRWVGLLARIVLGGALVWAAVAKLGRPVTSARAVQAYQILPFELAAYVGYALPVVELVLGLLLLTGLFTRISALASTVLMVIFVAGIISAWARGLSIDCGCFGGGGAISPEETAYPLEIARDLLFAACGAWLVARPATPLSLDARLGHAPQASSNQSPTRPEATPPSHEEEEPR